MKSNPNKYIESILFKLAISSEPTELADTSLLKAARWACGDAHFLFEGNRIAALQPVLESLKGESAKRWFSPQELSLEKSFFPDNTQKPTPDQVQKRVDAIKKAMSQRIDNLLTFLHFHTSTLAVSESLSDLPLFDFIKTTAAIAHCLEHGNGKLRLAGGSISGIQSYLYDIVSKRAGKLLKGRSFYLQLLSDSLAERFLETFKLSDAHIVYSSGGGFYVLMPDYEGVLDEFEDFKSKVIKDLYKTHKINLTCEFAISGAFDEKAEVPKIWDELLQNLNEAKTQRLSHNSDLLKDLLRFVDEGGADNDENSKFTRDTVTNEQILRAEAKTFDDDGNLVHPFTNAQQYLGRSLRDANIWVSSKTRFHEDCFEDRLGYFHFLDDNIPKKLPADAKILILNEPLPNGAFIFYGGNKIPVFEKDFTTDDGDFFEKGSPKTFDHLAQSDEGKSLSRLGILRMDVDNLGKIFSKDIGSPVSFARYAAVSRSLDWFFKGYLNTIHTEICQTSGQKFSEKTIIIYSGGDDLFIVGRWLETLEMACRIREEFKKWSGGSLTISGGVAILPDKFPVMQGANLAGEKEKLAKNYSLNGQKLKNAVCFFDQTLNWENEMPDVLELKKRLERWLCLDENGERNKKEGKFVDNSILRKIDQHAESRKEQEKQSESPRWIWNMVYDFGRFAGRLKDKELADELREIATKASFGDDHFRIVPKKRAVPFLYLLQTAARWVELERRTLSND